VALYLPWGTGPRRAGLSPANQSATVGPPSFDVDRRGRIHLLDPLQRRIAVFDGARLVRQARVTPASDLTVAADGTTFLATQRAGRVSAVSLTPSGRVLHRWRLGRGILAEIRGAGNRGLVHLLPLDAWLRLGAGRDEAASGLPQPSGSILLSSVVGRNVRLGLVRAGRVSEALELHSRRDVGELALAARDGGGYLAVFRVLRHGPAPAEQFQVVRVGHGGRITSFAVPDRSFTEPMASSRFRLGADGNLYQLATFPDGMRILRYDLGERA
jgi:hypothetical protein